MKKIGISKQDFKCLRDADKCFVDKSMLIAEILDCDDTGIYLFTRPRRFGKSTNMSMMDAFFNIRYQGNGWFDGLKISSCNGYDRYRNAFPVISLDLKCSRSIDFNWFVGVMKCRISMLCSNYDYLCDSPKLSAADRSLFAKYRSGEMSDFDCCLSLANLSRMLSIEHGSKVIILIDEYDSPINMNHGAPFFEDVRRFMKEMFSSALKDNDNLQMGVITGVMQIAKESIFSGLKNLRVDNILSDRFDGMFGFTDDEVRSLCREYGHPEKFAEAKSMYDGYLFGKTEIYNPWSVLRYIDSGFKPDTYWAGTSGNGIIGDLLDIADDGVREKIIKLLSNGSIPVNIHPSMSLDDISSDPENIFSVMAMSGYLRAEDRGQSARIPNSELLSVFGETLMGKRGLSGNDASSFFDACSKGRAQEMADVLSEVLKSSVSSRCLRDEIDYQMLVMGLIISQRGSYGITADHESGSGYHDIRLVSRDGLDANIVIEIKRTKDTEKLEGLAEKAIAQIREKDYAHGLRGRTLLYGIAFCGKDVRVVTEEL